MNSIYGLTPEQMTDAFLSIGEKKFRAQQVFEWIYRKDVYDFSKMTNLSKDLQAKLSDNYSTDLLEIVEKQVSRDGTTKYLLQLEDGGYIETVLMIHPYGKSLCVTSQLGCNMGCKFCASGLLKKQRNLTAAEMVQQILTVQHDQNERVTHVVIMGTGEPFDNYDHVMNFIYIINAAKGLAIGARHITLSTCGLVPKIYDFANEGIQVNLAISLHASNDEIRNELMPINKTYPMDVLRTAIKDYIEKTNRRVTLEYILLKDVNDDVTNARQLAHYLRGLNVYVNLIPYNAVNEHGFKKSPASRIEAFKDELIRLRINCTLRKEHGGDIDGACGQLRAKKERRL
ncbi:MAG: 23S rRNA (adenine(2503)-C(2))-methyltransferase RlmN [Kandleria vitulina]|uniref:23S rRNA (adenine(2503)-C(2))-methyltransferase RlmN n=1 Tax=Kandleria vitulina TaxID=1630 RepID=UPI002E79D675|nr:23S rRNA (adenine(2503)-C(2))-methyltransferase RlmN [Kandleria vitulina]MEE0988423.1 23S rRNA (adenine(2503)-C(2))-methyltransferase RlmN [Kandleria vitulina]